MDLSRTCFAVLNKGFVLPIRLDAILENCSFPPVSFRAALALVFDEELIIGEENFPCRSVVTTAAEMIKARAELFRGDS